MNDGPRLDKVLMDGNNTGSGGGVMTQVFEAIYENGLLRPLKTVHLDEHEIVRVIIEDLPAEKTANASADLADDPLSGFRFSLGVPDFSETFDDYRFGRRKP